jgi:hypothetical protein
LSVLVPGGGGGRARFTLWMVRVPTMISGVEFLGRAKWQMTFGERSALEGLLHGLSPKLSIEVGTAEGGSLRTIAAYSEEVHSFDLVTPETTAASFPNVEIHTGDSHKQLPEFLAALHAEGRSVDFLLIDGDHTTEGVLRDALDVLEAPAAAHATILFHDTANDVVRAGLDAVDWDRVADLAYLDLDFVPGYAVVDGIYTGDCWGGLGLAVRDPERVASLGRLARQPFLPAPAALQAWQDAKKTAAAKVPSEVPVQASSGELEELRAHNARLEHWLDAMKTSASWKLTQPLRDLKTRVAGRR